MDTALISEVYMQRPVEMAALGLGQWFCNALNITDPKLFYSTTREAKTHIIEAKYNDIPDLINKLKSYNRSI